MLNKEKYANEIEKYIYRDDSFAVVDNKIVDCPSASCENCIFQYSDVDCDIAREKWANSKYRKSKYEIDWSKVPVDTLIWVGSNEHTAVLKRHFAKYENGIIYVYAEGTTSWNTNGKLTDWNYAELVEPNPAYMKEVR